MMVLGKGLPAHDPRVKARLRSAASKQMCLLRIAAGGIGCIGFIGLRVYRV